MYSDKVRELIARLPNRGILADATHTARLENPVCSDVTHLYLRVENDIVTDCRFQTYGCPAAIAASAAVAEWCLQKSLSECRKLERQALLDYLGGLPSHKLHGADLAIEVLRAALGAAAES